ncbi:hypothetical protein DSM104299_01005 [Baekduia alba]|uniref:hypothetical protein n=1 Tax=Baekduia alba TaxID=2997333 RepID=UPI002340A2CE|nr:hypothetical protein [Baekduia alba]WCB92310.1 hypothetical protein DSM104299_01000 [Baekduia alba]WCB92315.1 hypothetical protein DSM104299_01005 [Baekduia alba]
MSNYHGTDPSGSNDHTPDHIAIEAAEGITAFERLLSRSAKPAESVWTLEGRVAQTISEHAYAAAHELPAESELRAQLLDQAEDWLLFASMRGQTRYDQFDEAQRLSKGENGIWTWEALPLELRRTFYNERVYTIDEVREMAADRELQSINGVGPARERQILEALAATDANQDWLR